MSRLKLFIKKIISCYPNLGKIVMRLRELGRKLYIVFFNLDDRNVFPSDLIHTNHLNTRLNWDRLYRGYEDEAKIKSYICKINSYTMVTYDGLVCSFNIANHVQNSRMQGAIVETGVCQGGSAAMMCFGLQESKHELPHIYLFDSFEGLPHPKEIDYMPFMESDWGISRVDFNGRLSKTGALVGSLEEAEKAIYEIAKYPKDKVHFCKGWFQDTVPKVINEIEKISVLRLDADLYESTIYCLRHFYPKVVSGGFIIIDDYALKGCRAACDEFFAEIKLVPHLIYVDAVARYFMKP